MARLKRQNASIPELIQGLRNIAESAPMAKGTRTRLHAIAHGFETEFGKFQGAPKSARMTWSGAEKETGPTMHIVCMNCAWKGVAVYGVEQSTFECPKCHGIGSCALDNVLMRVPITRFDS